MHVRRDEINLTKCDTTASRFDFFDSTQNIIKQAEDALGCPLLVYWNSAGCGISHNDIQGLYEVLKKTGKNEKLAVCIKSEGGDITSSFRLVNLLKAYSNQIIALVPLEAVSAAAIAVLCADEIHIGLLGYLAFNSCSELNLYGDALSYHIADAKNCEDIARTISNYPLYKPISYKEAKSIGLVVDTIDDGLNDVLLKIGKLYSEAAKNEAGGNNASSRNEKFFCVLEANGIQMYRNNDDYCWQKTEIADGETQKTSECLI